MYVLEKDQVDTSLPEEIQEMVQALRDLKLTLLEKLSKELVKKRQSAIDYRGQTGIEQIWQEDREYYEGIDDLNRTTSRYSKSASPSGVVERNTGQNVDGKATAFFNITRQFVDSGAARMSDMLLPAGDWPFSIKPTPVPDDLAEKAEEIKEKAGLIGGTVNAPPIPGMPGGPGGEQLSQPVPKQPEEYKPDTTLKRAEAAKKRIEDWLVECRYKSETRKVIENAAQVGTGILKGPIPAIRKTKQTRTNGDSVSLIIKAEDKPESRSVKPENFFPDPTCGDDIQNGAFTCERDLISAKSLVELSQQKGYLTDQILQVIEEGPGKKNYTDSFHNGNRTNEDDSFEIWYIYCYLTPEELECIDVELGVDCKCLKLVPAMVVMVNDTPIRGTLNHLDSGEFPYDMMVWQPLDNSPWGHGIARQGRTAQTMLNASMRRMMDNAALSGAPQIVIRESAIRPADGHWQITGGKIWLATDEANYKSVADAFMSIKVDMIQAELNAIVELAYKMMEDSTGIFFILQGQQGAAPDSVGGMEMVLRSASTVLRRLARTYDERITEPHIRRYYEYLLIYGKDDEKGDVEVEAIGATALVERDIHSMYASGMLQLAENPAYGLDPEKAIEEVLKAQRMIPEKWQMDDEKKALLAQQPQPKAPQVEVAEIRAQVEQMKAQLKQQTDMLKLQRDTDRDLVYQSGVTERNEMEMAKHNEELSLRREIAMLDYANKHQITINDVNKALDKNKTDLAKTAMQLNLQKELSTTGRGTQVATPPMEPAGRAPEGQAFER